MVPNLVKDGSFPIHIALGAPFPSLAKGAKLSSFAKIVVLILFRSSKVPWRAIYGGCKGINVTVCKYDVLSLLRHFFRYSVVSA